MDNTKNNYEEILRKFDLELAKTIQKDVLSACLDTVWEQAYQEGYSKARNEILDEMYGRDTEASDYAALSYLDYLGNVVEYFQRSSVEDNQ